VVQLVDTKINVKYKSDKEYYSKLKNNTKFWFLHVKENTLDKFSNSNL